MEKFLDRADAEDAGIAPDGSDVDEDDDAEADREEGEGDIDDDLEVLCYSPYCIFSLLQDSSFLLGLEEL